MSITSRLDRIERFMRSRPDEEDRPVAIIKVPRKLTREEWMELVKKNGQPIGAAPPAGR